MESHPGFEQRSRHSTATTCERAVYGGDAFFGFNMATSTSIKSVCPYCGVGCGIVMEVVENRVIKVSGDKSHPANFGRLCTKGTTCAQALVESGRMDHAFVRHSRSQKPMRSAMETTISEVARRLRGILDAHGPDALAFYISGQMSLEAQYLANKLAKGFIGTNQIESNSRLCMASAGSGYKLSLGSDGPPGSYQDFDKADLFFVIGANMADCHPILLLRMMDRVKAGAKLIVVDPRRTTTADKADLFLKIKPGTDMALLNGLLHLLVKNGHTDPAFITVFTEGWEELHDFVEEYTPEKVAAITGLNETDIRHAADLIGAAPDWMSCWTMGLNQSTHGTWHTNAICNLHLATGAICRPGSGPFSLTGQPNAMGGREMGYMGPGLPGQRSVLSDSDRSFVEQVWDIAPGTLRKQAGAGTVALFDEMKTGKIKACWIICTNPVASVPNRQQVIEGLQATELVIVQDAFLDTETNRYADILLPGALWAEAEGVMVNTERNLTLMQKAVEPAGETLPDWKIIARIACEMGFASAFSYESAEAVFKEIQRFSNDATGYDLRGASYPQLRKSPMQWPCAPDSGQRNSKFSDDDNAEERPQHRNPIRYLNNGVSQRQLIASDGTLPRLVFATANGKAQFLARPYASPAELPDVAFPFVLNTGRLQHQWHTLTKTGKIATLNKLNPGPFVELHPEDAAELGIGNNDKVEVRSRRGRAVLPAVVTDRVRPGGCFTPFHWNDVFGEALAINAVTNDAIDPISQQPEFKFCAVALTCIEKASVLDSGLPGHTSNELTQLLSGFAAADTPPTLVLWASQTGTAECWAIACAERLHQQGHSVLLASMDTVKHIDLARVELVLCVTSTFGDGDPPDNGAALWQALKSPNAPTLKALHFGVLAFGDPSYDQFCGFGRNLDARLEALGAQRLLPRTECEHDADTCIQQWMANVSEILTLSASCVQSGNNSHALGLAAAVRSFAQAQQSKVATAPLTSIAFSLNSASGYNRRKPLHTTVKLNRLLNGPNAGKETRQYAFDLHGSDFTYEAGDALGVWPTNCPVLVDEMLAALKLSPETIVPVKGHGELALADALLRHVEIARITPDLLDFVQSLSGNAELTRLLRAEHKDELEQWLWGRQPVDLFQAFAIRCEALALLAQFKLLQPRLYSIASSPKAYPDEVHLTVSTVRYNCASRKRKGACSTFLADRSQQAQVPIFVQKSAHFRPSKDPQTSMIMVGPGTGIAPFRAFLQDRQADGATGRNWLFFGEQRAATDFYYREELEAMAKSGTLHRLDTAFSRDQTEKVYVQHRMAERGAELWAWLEQGAHFYVCGDASRMAKDVDAALKAVVQQHGAMSADAASDYVTQMAQQKRYARDVY